MSISDNSERASASSACAGCDSGSSRKFLVLYSFLAFPLGEALYMKKSIVYDNAMRVCLIGEAGDAIGLMPAEVQVCLPPPPLHFL